MGICEALCDMLTCKKGYINTFDLIWTMLKDWIKHYQTLTFRCQAKPQMKENQKWSNHARVNRDPFHTVPTDNRQQTWHAVYLFWGVCATIRKEVVGGRGCVGLLWNSNAISNHSLSITCKSNVTPHSRNRDAYTPAIARVPLTNQSSYYQSYI